MSSTIASLEVIPIVTPAVNASDCDGAADTVVVRLTDEEGRTGIGEADAPADLVRAFIEQPDLHVWSRNVRDLVVGRDPFPIASLIDELYEATLYPGRRGLGIHALSAIDIALHDLVGKQLGRPVYELLGGARKETLSPYATIFPGLPQGRSLAELMRDIGKRFEAALEAGFRAVKMECLFYDLVTDAELVAAIREGRGMLGGDIELMLDFGYRWSDWRAALWTLRRVEDCDIYFAEATLQHDDLEGHARLAERVETRVCGAEFAATRFECREWLTRGPRRRPAAGHQPLRRAHGDPAHRGAGRLPRRVGDPARLEDRHHRRGRAPFPRRHRQLPHLRVPLAAALGLADPQRARAPRAGDTRRPDGAPDRRRASGSSSTRMPSRATASTSPALRAHDDGGPLREALARVRAAADLLCTYPFACWHYGDSIGFEGLLAATDVLGDARYEGFVHGACKAWIPRAQPYREIDNTAPGYALCLLHERTGDEAVLAGLPRSGGLPDRRRTLRGVYVSFERAPLRTPYGGATLSPAEQALLDDPGAGAFVDCLHFDAPFLVKLGRVAGDERLVDAGADQALATIALLQQPDGFFAHFFLERTGQTYGHGWGRGQGWALLGLLDVIEQLPESHPHAREIRASFVRLAGRARGHAGARRPLADADRRPLQLPRDLDGLLRGCGPRARRRPRPAR